MLYFIRTSVANHPWVIQQAFPDLSATGGKSSEDSWGYRTKRTRIDDSGITSRSYSNLKM